MTLFKNKYRIESTRLPSWDYGEVGTYFITICTQNRKHYFGKVIREDVQLSSIGEIVADEWVKTAVLRPNIELDEWIIMPDHLHLIFAITFNMQSQRQMRTQNGLTWNQKQTKHAREKWQANSVGSIINQFKGACTKRIRRAGNSEFAWQPRFYDRIIRNEKALVNVRHYVQMNPTNWHKDQENLPNLYM